MVEERGFGQSTLEGPESEEALSGDELPKVLDTDGATAIEVQVAAQEPHTVVGLEAATHDLEGDLWIGLDTVGIGHGLSPRRFGAPNDPLKHGL